MKTCTRCGKRKRLAAFYLTKRGHMSWCKECCSEQSKGRYKYARREPVDGIACAICGAKRHLLAQHLVSAHSMSAREYRERFGLPTASESWRSDMRQQVVLNERLPDRRKRRSHCKRGHPLRGKNVIRRADGQRQCRTCLLDGLRGRYASDADYAEAKRARSRDYRQEKMQDPEWRERQRTRDSERMRKKRASVRKRKRETWTAVRTISAAQKWKRRTGHPPTQREWRRDTNRSAHPSPTTVRNVFGSWSAMIAAAGFDPLSRGQHRGLGRCAH